MRICCYIVLALLWCLPAHAWKPKTHIFLAEEARRDAVDDGKITVTRLGSDGKSVGTITLAVDPDIREALKDYKEYYWAGCLGPDAYPDIATGQSIIHTDAPSNTEGGSGAWMEHVWRKSLSFPKRDRQKYLRVRAFAAGFLTHGAGDLYAHTFVNRYAGGDFAFDENAARHLVLEGYIGRRTKTPPITISIIGIEDFIYDTLIDCRQGTELNDRLYRGESVSKSLPYLFSRLRDRLSEDIEDFNCRQDNPAVRATAPIIAYKKAWRKDIDTGLKQLPHYSHRIARVLVLPDEEGDGRPAENPPYPEDVKRGMSAKLTVVLDEYTNKHLLSMAGAPDAVGQGREFAQKKYEEVFKKVVEEVITDKKIADALINGGLKEILLKSLSVDYDRLTGYLTNPELYFNDVLSPANVPVSSRTGKEGAFKPDHLTLTDFNRNHLKINESGYTEKGAKFLPDDFAPAYNTVVLSKLILIAPDEIETLVSGLRKPIINILPVTGAKLGQLDQLEVKRIPRSANADAAQNLMFGFDRKFDGSFQWAANPETMTLMGRGVYYALFRPTLPDETNLAGTREMRAAGAKPAPVPDFVRVTVKIDKVEQLSNDLFALDTDIGSKPDYFARVAIGNDTFRTDEVANSESISPRNWMFNKTVPATGELKISIRIFDEDIDADDPIAIKGEGRTLSLTLSFDETGKNPTLAGLENLSVGKSKATAGTGNDRARVTFLISVDPL